MTKDKKFGILNALITEILFGFSFLFTKSVTESVSTSALLGWRFLLAAFCLWILTKVGVVKVNFKGKSLKKVLPLALFHPICYFICESEGIHRTSASESGCIIAIIPVVTLLFSILFLKIKPTRRQVLGILMTLIGVFAIVLTQSGQPTFELVGYLLLFGAVLSYCAYAVMTRKAGDFTDIEKSYVMIFTAAVVFGLSAVIEAVMQGSVRSLIRLPFTNRDFLTAVLYLSIGSSILAFICNNIALSCLGTTAASSFAGICTVVSVLSGVIFLHEPFTLPQIIGTILVIIGVTIANGSTNS